MIQSSDANTDNPATRTWAQPALPLELLPALRALLETQSVSDAARLLSVGQPAMSRTLDKLRRALGDDLLVRDGRGLARTRYAQELLPELRTLMATARRVLSPPAEFDPTRATGVVTLALGDDMQALLAGRLLQRIRAEAPGLDVRVRPIGLENVGEAQRGLIDLAVMADVRSFIPVPILDDFVILPQYTRRFVTVSRRPRLLDVDEFAAAEHVMVWVRDEGGFVDDALAALGRSRRVAVAVPSFLSAIRLVESSDLVATIPDDVVRGLASHLHVQRCPVKTPELPMCVIWPPRFTTDSRHRWLRSRVIETLGDCASAPTPSPSA